MMKSFYSFIWVLGFFFFISNAFSQQPVTRRSTMPLFRWDDRSLLEQGLEMDRSQRECSFLEFGELRQTYLDFGLENDVISNDDVGYTHGLQLGYNMVGDWARLRFSYSTGLYTDESKTFENPSSGKTEAITTFLEIVDLRLDYESRPYENGMFYEVGTGVQYYGTSEQVFGGRWQQDLLHGFTEDTGIGGSERKNYEYGDVEQISFLARGGVGFLSESRDHRFYCRPFVGAEGNTEFERSNLVASVQSGFALCQDSDGAPLIELVGHFQCRQYLADIDERSTFGTLDARFNLFELGATRQHDGWMNVMLTVGVTQPFENAEDTFMGNVDDDLTGHIFIGGQTLFGPSRR